MKTQKEEIIRHVQDQKGQGGSIGGTLAEMGVKRSTYYRWKKPLKSTESTVRVTTLTPEEKKKIEETKDQYPGLRHRQIQGMIQKMGMYLSPSAVYGHLKSLGRIEPYERRPSPWDVPRYEAAWKFKLWGTDWSRMKINWLRWYLLVLIDYYSRKVVAYDIVPSVNAGHIKRLYQAGLKSEGIHKTRTLPELRVDRGSPNTSYVTRDFFDVMGADLSFSRVNRPTDNARTERFFGTIKQEEIYVVRNYPDEVTARESIENYIRYYNEERPHQALWNFTPGYVHQVNNKSLILAELKKLKRDSRARRRAYWENSQQNNSLLNLPVLSTS
jgi:putative transposase